MGELEKKLSNHNTDVHNVGDDIVCNDDDDDDEDGDNFEDNFPLNNDNVQNNVVAFAAPIYRSQIRAQSAKNATETNALHNAATINFNLFAVADNDRRHQLR